MFEALQITNVSGEETKKRLSPAVEIYIEEEGQKIHIKSNQIHPNQIEYACTVYSTANQEGNAAGDLTSPIGDRVFKSGDDLNKI